jgi:hypothetical protein
MSKTNPNMNEVQEPDDDCCERCGGDGIIMLSEAGPGVWGEDCFCDEDKPIKCPACGGDGISKE